jgi:hypothetical protein
VKKSRFSEEQIIAMLRQHEAGMKVGDLCRRSNQSYAAATAYLDTLTYPTSTSGQPRQARSGGSGLRTDRATARKVRKTNCTTTASMRARA